MAGHRNKKGSFSRRAFLKGMQWAPAVFLPAPLRAWPFRPPPQGGIGDRASSPPLDDDRLTPHYPARSPLDDVVRLVSPGSDEYITEGYAAAVASMLGEWGQHLRAAPPATAVLGKFVDSSIQFTSLDLIREFPLRGGGGIEVVRRNFSARLLSGRQPFLQHLKTYLDPLARVDVADFEIYECSQVANSPRTLEARIRYEFVGTRTDHVREERIGSWLTQWLRDESGSWRVLKWNADEETVSRARWPVFVEITSRALGQTSSYKEQLSRGADYWRTVLDGAIGVDVYGNNGVAVGDFNNDGLDDLYVCQTAGLPNRLYRNRGDGTFDDVTEASGVGVLDFTACALFADFQNRGLQDLLVVCATGPLLFVNDGQGKFSLKRDAFRFATPPQGAFSHAAAADYDRDGRLDVYFCLYNYYQGLDQYRFPVPYFDARNGPPNLLLHNEGDGVFRDRTEAAGLNVDNDRFSFACCWGDCDSDGWPDLYVANDFGRNNLYRNQGDGTFKVVSGDAQVEEAGAGMSACWLDFDNDGNQDLYAAGMWVAAGMRVFGQPHFHAKEPDKIRALYRRHMAGNTLYRNEGNGKFQNLALRAGVEMGRWSWSADAWDFDHDGYPDLYMANGYITGLGQRDVSSFFWRQVVSRSPQDSSPSPNYERGWGAINELIRSDATWNGRERNVFFANNRDGTFSNISGVCGLDFRDDSRAFVLADFDGDGRLEIVLKNRSGPQLRVLRLAMKEVGNAIAFRLRGTKSNRDAIGAAVTVTLESSRQTKYLQAGSGFLSQHTKELFFGLGKAKGVVTASIRWPSGLVQSFDQLPLNHRIEIEEGTSHFRATSFASPPDLWERAGDAADGEIPPSEVGTWLIEPVKAPVFSLPDLAGAARELRSLQGSCSLVNFWRSDSPASRDQLRRFGKAQSGLASSGLQIVAINVDDAQDPGAVQSYAAREGFSFPILLATSEIAGAYNILYRYLFDRQRDLPLPASFLVDEAGMVVKAYQGLVDPEQLLADQKSIPRTPAERMQKALPLAGTLYQGEFRRNDFTYGVAFFQHGYLDEAVESFKQVIAAKPNDPEAYYNLGTLYLRRNSMQEARRCLEQAVKLRPNYPEAWNNVGMLAAQEGHADEAIRNFRQSLILRPAYTTALINLGNLLRRQKSFAEARELLERALEIEPDDPEANYSMGMLYAQQDQLALASEYLEAALRLRSDYPDALNNLGVLFVRLQRYAEAEQKFRACIQVSPKFDQAYLNLARLYAILGQKEKAREVLLALLEQQPQHKMAQQALEMLH